MTARSRLSWGLMALALAVALVVGVTTDRGETTDTDRARDLAASVKCPTCRSQSALESDAVAARAIRTDIDRRVRSGESDSEIRAYLVSRYGEGILLTPKGSGVTGLVWVLPVAALIVAAVALAFTFRRWRGGAGPDVTDDDRRLVERFLRRPRAAPGP